MAAAGQDSSCGRSNVAVAVNGVLCREPTSPRQASSHSRVRLCAITTCVDTLGPVLGTAQGKQLHGMCGRFLALLGSPLLLAKKAPVTAVLRSFALSVGGFGRATVALGHS